MEQNSLIFDHNIVNMFYQYLLGEAKEFPDKWQAALTIQL